MTKQNDSDLPSLIERREAIEATLAKAKPPCKNHPNRPIRENLDGDNLCQECCDQWVRGEGISAQENKNG